MNTAQLIKIGEESAENLKGLISEMENKIHEAEEAAFEQADAEGKEVVKITLNHKIELDLGRNIQKDYLSVSVKHQETKSSLIPDPNQPELDFEKDDYEEEEAA